MDEVTIKLPDWEMNFFQVFGVNPKTNRKKSKIVFVVGDDEEKAKQKSGLLNISSVEHIEPDPPSTAQIEYARDLGIAYNDCYSKQDYSALISIATGEIEFVPIDKNAAEFAAEHNIYLSQYDSLIKLYVRYFNDLSYSESLAFFAFTMYQSLNGFTCYDYMNHPQCDLFIKFANDNANNDEFKRSFDRYESVSEFIPNYGVLRKTTNAYKICYDFFVQNGVVAPTQKKVDDNSPIFKNSETNPVNEQPIENEKKKYNTCGTIFGVLILILALLIVILVSCHK